MKTERALKQKLFEFVLVALIMLTIAVLCLNYEYCDSFESRFISSTTALVLFVIFLACAIRTGRELRRLQRSGPTGDDDNSGPDRGSDDEDRPPTPKPPGKRLCVRREQRSLPASRPAYRQAGPLRVLTRSIFYLNDSTVTRGVVKDSGGVFSGNRTTI